MDPAIFTTDDGPSITMLPGAYTKLQEVTHVDTANRLLGQGWVLVACIGMAVGSRNGTHDRIVYVLGQLPPMPRLVAQQDLGPR